jgi:hypothetical protein
MCRKVIKKQAKICQRGSEHYDFSPEEMTGVRNDSVLHFLQIPDE